MLNKYFDNTDSKSLANKFRKKRFRYFKKFIADLPKPVKILDAGGTELFWKMMEFTSIDMVNIMIVNIEEDNITLPNFSFIKSDVKDLSCFKDKEFDIVFSNSVIEHVGDFAAQEQMAKEIQRVGKKFFIQTPNYYFPFEPHFMFPFFQFLPQFIKVFLVRNFKMGWFNKAETEFEARKIIGSINLLTAAKLRKLFSKGILLKEKMFFLSKSIIIYG